MQFGTVGWYSVVELQQETTEPKVKKALGFVLLVQRKLAIDVLLYVSTTETLP